jgi:hypothetical protein
MGFNDFIRERRCLKNVSPATVSWYTHALQWRPNESPSKAELKDVVLRIRGPEEAGSGQDDNLYDFREADSP